MIKKISSFQIKIFNALVFQIGWFVCVLQSSLFSSSFTVAAIIIHILLLAVHSNPFSLKKELSWILAIAAIGFVVETLFFSLGVLSTDIPTDRLFYLIAPPAWIICLWLLFATALRTSLGFLLNKPWLTYSVTTILAPSSYVAGSQLNAHVDINQPLILNLVIISMTWISAIFLIINLKHYYFEDIFNDQ